MAVNELIDSLCIKKLDRRFLETHIKQFVNVLKSDSPYYWSEENFLMDLPGKWEYSLYVEFDGKIVGYAICSIKKDVVHLHHLMVKEEYRAMGIGKRLLEVLIKHVKNKGKNKVSLRVKSDNLIAIRLYSKLGFKIITKECTGDYFMLLEI